MAFGIISSVHVIMCARCCAARKEACVDDALCTSASNENEKPIRAQKKETHEPPQQRQPRSSHGEIGLSAAVGPVYCNELCLVAPNSLERVPCSSTLRPLLHFSQSTALAQLAFGTPVECAHVTVTSTLTTIQMRQCARWYDACCAIGFILIRQPRRTHTHTDWMSHATATIFYDATLDDSMLGHIRTTSRN